MVKWEVVLKQENRGVPCYNFHFFGLLEMRCMKFPALDGKGSPSSHCPHLELR
ncbi:hypothetical protein OIU78_017520 [Salix suchowensis]|nr:hypothetical protein OIU78_017520 [Salix suchowensis]